MHWLLLVVFLLQSYHLNAFKLNAKKTKFPPECKQYILSFNIHGIFSSRSVQLKECTLKNETSFSLFKLRFFFVRYSFCSCEVITHRRWYNKKSNRFYLIKMQCQFKWKKAVRLIFQSIKYQFRFFSVSILEAVSW